MSAQLLRDAVAGGVAGLVGGLVFWLAFQAQGTAVTGHGLLGLNLSGLWLVPHLLVATLLGAILGAIIRYEPLGYAAATSIGLFYGLLLWIVGPITLGAALSGQGPTWSLSAASAAFPSLIGHLFYGGLTGISFYLLVALYLRLRPAPNSGSAPEEVPKQRVVILGGGFGGMAAAQRLEQIFRRDASLEVTLVSQSNYLLFTPLLAEVASSSLEAQHISAPIRASCPHTRFRRATVEAIDATTQTVRIRSSVSASADTLPYDHLLLALGSVPNYFGLPGMAEYSFTLKTLEDASRLRDHVIAMLERADVEPDEEDRRRQLTFAVVGGGFAGTEIISELFDLVHGVLRYYPNVNRRELRLVLIHSRERILPELSPSLGEYALRKLQARGIEFLLNTRVAGATPDSVLLNDASPVPAYTKVWTAGNQPNPVLQTLSCERNRAGAVIVDRTLQAKGTVNIWAVGDCAEIPDPNHEGQSYPPTAQHALGAGKTVADNIAATIRGKPLKEFRFKALGLLVGLGQRTGAAEIMGLRFSGLLAWFMWRTIYLSKLPGLEKKMRVALDWTIDLFFPRDIVLFSSPQRPISTHVDEPDPEADIPDEQSPPQAGEEPAS